MTGRIRFNFGDDWKNFSDNTFQEQGLHELWIYWINWLVKVQSQVKYFITKEKISKNFYANKILIFEI